jgi:hypothetical protein
MYVFITSIQFFSEIHCKDWLIKSADVAEKTNWWVDGKVGNYSSGFDAAGLQVSIQFDSNSCPLSTSHGGGKAGE